MKLENMFKKKKNMTDGKDSSKTRILNGENIRTERKRPEVPEGLLKKCNKCGKAIVTEDVKANYNICPKCGGYFRIHAYRRIHMIADEGSFEEWDKDLNAGNPMNYKGYEEKVKNLKEKTGLQEAIVTGKIKIDGMDAVIGVCDGRFLMASMGQAVGEKIARAVERATKERLPVILFACSGGARMQEGITSLMQMAKTSAALKRHSDAGLLYISVLTDPTTGGVTASFAMLGDVILAEPKALIGFAGPRVIEQTIRQKLPKGFQRSEFLLEHGFIDRIVERHELREVLAQILRLHPKNNASDEMNIQADSEEQKNPDKAAKIQARNMTAWDRVQISRKNDRPVGSDYIESIFEDFIEFHGDRYYGDDPAIIGGIASYHGRPVTVIAQAKGSNTKENIERNFGMPSPEGYRKALRLMKQAEKHHRPVICFVDTPGAFCGMEAEERGQGEAIARNLFEMSGITTPVLSVVIGEGGSGGALAMAVADEVWMLENAVYSILSPEGFASILWKDSTKAKEAAEVMKLTALDLYEKGIVEKVIPEPECFTRDNLTEVTRILDAKIDEFLAVYGSMPEAELLDHRYMRFREM
ncbi:MAG: acetyl-CoA carboxylase carboxyltransferase subunit alpha [Lachnospiraceae bacterium]|nr:acetyl-CoA carboxylase carboxyltransferase subunit alpha [Lachnospiraceae bacterium]